LGGFEKEEMEKTEGKERRKKGEKREEREGAKCKFRKKMQITNKQSNKQTNKQTNRADFFFVFLIFFNKAPLGP
jgi:hypothetical protein